MTLDICKVAAGWALGLFGCDGDFVDWWSGPYRSPRAAKIALSYWLRHPARWQR